MGKIIAYIVILSMLGAAAWFIFDAGVNSERANNTRNINIAVAAARKDEQFKQGKVNDAVQKQFNELNDINSKLNGDLDKLRKRAARRQPASGTNTICEGATGKSLSSADAGFLTREAARADKLRIGLKTCYDYADSVSQ